MKEQRLEIPGVMWRGMRRVSLESNSSRRQRRGACVVDSGLDKGGESYTAAIQILIKRIPASNRDYEEVRNIANMS